MSSAESHDVAVGARTVRAFVSGAVDGNVVVFHTGTPSPPVDWPLLEDVTTELGLTLVTYDRPGYAGSDRQPGRCVADAATDVEAILDDLRVDAFVTVGWSGGGPHALACAALLPDRCRTAATIGTLSPLGSDDGAWWADLSRSNADAFRAAVAGEDALRGHLEPGRRRFLTVTGPRLAEALGDLVSAADQAALTPELADMLARARRRAATSGLDGWVDDLLAVVRPWGFEPGAITRPVTIWHGREDRFVPVGHAERLAATIPGATARLLDDDGHLSVASDRLHDVLADLARPATTEQDGPA